MKNIILINNVKSKIFPATIALFVLFFLNACAQKVAFPVSPVVPAAQGTVQVKQDDNDNYSIKIKIKHLAAPERLNPPKETYVVWMETEATRVVNIGQLDSSSGLFTSTFNASLETVSTYKPSEVFITAENNPNIQYPGNQVVLRADVE